MEHYLHRNRLSETLDALGAHLLIYGAALLWFVWLWGLSMPALLAGLALGTLGRLARTRWRQRNVARREKALRARLGGELMLEEMLLTDARSAHFRAALLLAERWPITIKEARDEGTICRQGEETLLVQCIRMPDDGELSAGDLVGAQRAVRQCKAQRGIVCPLGRVSQKVAARAEQAVVPLRIVRRETLLDIAGHMSPVTDEQLVSLGARRRRPAGQGGIAKLLFRREKARKYHCYGAGMLMLYLLTGARLYAVAGMVCLTMGTLSGCVRQGPEKL